jgi:hypothetical protein
MAHLRNVRRGVREGSISVKEPNCQGKNMGWLTLDMSGEESGKGICLSGEREDLSGRSPAVRAATLPLEILSSDPEHATIQ